VGRRGAPYQRMSMKRFNRGMMLGVALLAFSMLSAAAVSVHPAEICPVNWTVPKWTPETAGGGRYGVLQFKLGNGPLDAKTVFFGNNRSLIIQAPLYVIVGVVALGGSMVAFVCRTPRPRADDSPAEPIAAESPPSHTRQDGVLRHGSSPR